MLMLRLDRRALRTSVSSISLMSAMFLLPGGYASAQAQMGNAQPVAPAILAQLAEPATPSAADRTMPAGSAEASAGTTPDLAPTAAGPGSPGVEPAGAEIVVTGSRLTTGTRTPTPVTVISSVQLAQTAPNNIADGLAQLPAFGGSVSTSSPSSLGTTGTIGQNLLNLRGLGDSRNLVLLDGRRLVSNNQDFAVDINTIPQSLVSRVDVVTGGASAAYGSDAVAGVVNFVLDTKFVGLKGELSAGTSTYGDIPHGKASLTYGGQFFGDRLHLVASIDYFRLIGLKGDEANPRTWFTTAAGLIPNTLAARPANLVVPDIRSSQGTAGGLITNTVLRGTQFGPNGVTSPFNYGFNAGTAFQSGGDGARVNYGFTPSQERNNSFVHASFDLSPNVSIFAEGGYSFSRTDFYNSYNVLNGASFNLTIFNNNAYLPVATKATLAANNITSFRLGRTFDEVPEFDDVTSDKVLHGAIGFQGKNLFGLAHWNWGASYSYGRSEQLFAQAGIINLQKIYAAVDAVINPSTGQIVCRSNFYTAAGVFVPGGTGLTPDCRPINVLGVGSIDPASIPSFTGTTTKLLVTRQDVFEAHLSGDLGERFQLGADPISFAIGAEYRKDSAVQTSDALSQLRIDFTGVRGGPAALSGRLGQWRYGNAQPFSGSTNVKEGFLEVGVPILRDVPFARSLTANGAVRYTSYSLAGDVQTWKGGLDYSPVDGLRLRGTVSRDIRAPNILELFNSALQSTTNVLYPSSTNGVTTPDIAITSGNLALKPEKAITQTYGVILTPRFLRGLSFSVDYYDIKIKDAITTLTAQNEVDFCAAGQAQYCSLISVANGVISIKLSPLNAAQLVTRGLDFEVNYNTRLFNNPFGIRLLANDQIANFSQAPSAAPLQTRGLATAPYWKAQLQLQYAVAGFSAFVNERFISAVKMDPNQVEGIYIDNNRVPPVFYTDVTLKKYVNAFGSKSEVFLTIENLFDRDPPVDVAPPSNTSSPTSVAYDRIGRTFTAGVRFKF